MNELLLTQDRYLPLVCTQIRETVIDWGCGDRGCESCSVRHVPCRAAVVHGGCDETVCGHVTDVDMEWAPVLDHGGDGYGGTRWVVEFVCAGCGQNTEAVAS